MTTGTMAPPGEVAVDVSPKEEGLLTTKDVCGRLNVSRGALYAKIRRGEIRALKFGSLIRFHPRDVDAYVKRSWTAPGPHHKV